MAFHHYSSIVSSREQSPLRRITATITGRQEFANYTGKIFNQVPFFFALWALKSWWAVITVLLPQQTIQKVNACSTLKFWWCIFSVAQQRAGCKCVVAVQIWSHWCQTWATYKTERDLSKKKTLHLWKKSKSGHFQPHCERSLIYGCYIKVEQCEMFQALHCILSIWSLYHWQHSMLLNSFSTVCQPQSKSYYSPKTFWVFFCFFCTNQTANIIYLCYSNY